MNSRVRVISFLLVGGLLAGASCTAGPAGTEVIAPSSSAEVASTAIAVPTVPLSTPTPSAMPAPRFFTEQFENGFPDWSLFQVGGEQSDLGLRAENGKLVFDITRSAEAYVIYDGSAYEDVRVDVTAQNLGSNEAVVILICRYDPPNGWYEFQVADSGQYSIWYGEGTTPYNRSFESIYLAGQADNMNRGHAVNTYSATCKGATLSLSVNGVIARTVQESRWGLQRGKIGITAVGSRRFPVTVAFDQLTTSQP